MVQQFIYSWYRVSINFCLLIQESVINAHSQCALLFFLMKMTGAPKGLVLECIQPRLMYLHNYFQISANFSLLIRYSQGLGGYLCSSISLFCVWCFCPPDNLASKTRLYSYHTDFPNNFLYMGVLQLFHCPVILDVAVKLGC